MHILFLTHYFPPEVNAPASRTYEHARLWVRSGDVSVTIITNNPNHPRGILYPGYRNRWFCREVMDGIEVVRVKTYLAANAAVFRRSLNYLFFMVAAICGATRVKTPDVVVATSPQFFCAVAGYIVSRMKRRPFVFELRDLWPESIVTVGAMKRGFAVRVAERLELFLYRKAACVVAVTNSFRENLIARGVPAQKIVVIRNGVDLEFYRPLPRPDMLAQQLGASGKFIASYIGTVGMAHAVENLVDVADLLRLREDILLLIIGEGARKNAVERLVAERRLTNIKVLPAVGKKAVRDYYALSDLNLVTLRDQPLFRTVIPSKIFEIMAMGRPILCSVQGEARQTLEEAGAAEFVKPENADEMAAKILELAGDRARLERLASNGRKYAEAYCSRDYAADELLRWLREAADQG